jgi:RecT family
MNVVTKAPAPVDAPPPATSSVLAPATFAELVEFAEIAARSQLVPKDYRGHPEDILLAVQLGSEVGLRPMQALQNIAVINGHPAVFGDALPGLCKASAVYEDLIETWEREDDADFLTAVCVAKRRGSTPVTARFSVLDAKKAGLWTKPGPWQTYPRRMLQMRARSFALRDAFPDVLKGLISVEEAQDLPAPADRLATKPTATGPTIDATAEPTQPADAPVTAPKVYLLSTKQGTMTFRTAEKWLDAWAKLVRGCKAVNALDKLETARDANQRHITAVATFDPASAATLTAELDRALAPPSSPS